MSRPTCQCSTGLPKLGLASRTELRLNFINIAIPFPWPRPQSTQNTTDRFGTLIAGWAPAYHVSSGLAVLITAKQAF